MQTPESLQARFNLDVRPNHEVTAINRDEKTVTIKHGGIDLTESYDALISHQVLAHSFHRLKT